MELGRRVALAVDNARLFAEAQEAARRREEALRQHCQIEEQLTLLVEASSSLSASLDMDSVAKAVLTLSRRLVAADAHAVWRYQVATGRWGIVLASGLSEDYQRSTIEVMEHTPRLPDLPDRSRGHPRGGDARTTERCPRSRRDPLDAGRAPRMCAAPSAGRWSSTTVPRTTSPRSRCTSRPPWRTWRRRPSARPSFTMS